MAVECTGNTIRVPQGDTGVVNGELGYLDGRVYKSGMDDNVYLPGTQGAPWELML